jgi:uncharacterized protein YceH (UPF0502 family)
MESEETFQLPQLTTEEVRVLGALMEKSKTTPDYYPMTLNGLTAACNQKSSRNPVVEYDEGTVVLAIDGLKRKGFASPVIGGGSRTAKYKHNFNNMFDIPNGGVAAMCLLFLRGPLTAGEINSNSGRLHEFQSLASVQETSAHAGLLRNAFGERITKTSRSKRSTILSFIFWYSRRNGARFFSKRTCTKIGKFIRSKNRNVGNRVS